MTEYIVMLAVVVFIAVGAFRALRPILQKFGEDAGDVMRSRLSRGLHEIRLSR